MDNQDHSPNNYQLEVWKRLWQSRDFELSHFWQRSIFLSAFIVLMYTGYGAFQVFALGKILQSDQPQTTYITTSRFCLDCPLYPTYISTIQSNHPSEKKNLAQMIATSDWGLGYTFVSVFLCAIGIILSLLWVMMTKGSKFCYEAYEYALHRESHRLTAIKTDDNTDSNTFKTDIQKASFLENAYVDLDTYEQLHYRAYNIYKNKISKCNKIKHALLDSYRYSVSKINIFLGWLSLGIFAILGIIHICIGVSNICAIQSLYICIVCIVCIVIVFIFLLVMLIISLTYLKGGKKLKSNKG